MSDSLSSQLMLPNGNRIINRFAKSAMSEGLGDAEHAPTDALVQLYEQWGAGGLGLIVTGNVMVDARSISEPRNVVVEDETHVAKLNTWARAAKRSGARVWMQINHPGRQAVRGVAGETVAPSAVRVRRIGPMFKTPRPLTDGEIEGLVARFARTASVAEQAGFDGVQLHGAHGYLISQFLSPLSNVRDDRWGGDAVRRRNFLVETLRAIRRVVSPTFDLGVKLNSADFQRGGFTEDESMDVVRALSNEAVDLLEISGGTYEAPQMMGGASTRAREAYFLEYAERVRAVAAMPLMVTGGFRTAAGMQEAVRSGATDVVGLARPLALEPDLPRRILSGEADQAITVDIGTGIKKIDAFLQIAWHQYQIRRMARGKRPDPNAGRLTALGAAMFSPMPA